MSVIALIAVSHRTISAVEKIDRRIREMGMRRLGFGRPIEVMEIRAADEAEGWSDTRLLNEVGEIDGIGFVTRAGVEIPDEEYASCETSAFNRRHADRISRRNLNKVLMNAAEIAGKMRGTRGL